MKIRLNKLIGYILMATSAAGYYGYYLKSKQLLWIWGICFAIGLIFLGVANNYIYKRFHSKLVYLDILFCAFVWLIPLIKAPYGLAIAIMMIISVSYAFLMSAYENKLFS